MSKRIGGGWMVCILWLAAWAAASDAHFQAGAAAVPITPFGKNADWDGGTTDSGVWGEQFVDKNHNGRWDSGETFEDDAANTSLDRSSDRKYDGIYLAGFSINILTLLAIVLATGLVVDDSIVVLENIVRRKAMGTGPRAATPGIAIGGQ